MPQTQCFLLYDGFSNFGNLFYSNINILNFRWSTKLGHKEGLKMLVKKQIRVNIFPLNKYFSTV